MHLLASTSGVIDGAAEAIDLKQSPADVVVLSAADSELANLARAADQTQLSIRLANLMQLQHNFAVDLYAEKTLAHAKLIIVRVLGGSAYWPYGVDVIEALAREKNIKLVFLSGGNDVDQTLTSRSTLNPLDCERIRQYLAFGGSENALALLQFCNHLLNETKVPHPATPLASAGFYRQSATANFKIVFYRSVIEGGQTAPVDALITSLGDCSAIYVASLKDKASAAFLRENLIATSVIINATSFAVGDEANDPLSASNCPVLQVTLAGNTEDDWQKSTRGLRPTDLAMSVVLPELDGRIYTRAISFKADQMWHEKTQCRIVTYQPVQNRVDYVATLAKNWALLRETKNSKKNIAIILANYPDKDGRIANGVGYDTPASTIEILKALQGEGYDVREIPVSGNDLISRLQSSRRKSGTRSAGTDHNHLDLDFRQDDCVLSLENYQKFFSALPQLIRTQITSQWGEPASDPTFQSGNFPLAINVYGNIAVAIQPPRGYGIDPKSTYHDPALVPPHSYLAFYFWMRHHFKAHAIIHNGKHGNLEWLPGKSTALSENCYPEITLGPTPQLYPFIVNDPGEGTQAKRRTSAVIIDHLTPPLTRAESYGPMKDLEALVDEYYLAAGLDQRRVATLRQQIFELTSSTKLDKDAGLTGTDDSDLQKLDGFLCDLKEAQIRDGLHILGLSPTCQQEVDLLVALTRVPRGLGEGGEQSLIRALSNDFNFGAFDPLTCDFSEPWKGERPAELLKLLSAPWRTNGDTVERLELHAAQLLARLPPPCGEGLGVGATPSSEFGLKTNSERVATPTPALPTGGRENAGKVLEYISSTIRPALASCGPNEITSLLKGLAGLRVRPGPSGAPTRGRLDVLPTGKNFYSIDNRAVPTPTAWTLGQKSAEALLTRHFQDHGQHLKTVGLSAWGTANMRTGGDDIAQALALIGAKPIWDTSSWRVTGYEIIPLAKLGRPRVDVTLRISGFFRDAFPAQIELLDKAFRAVADLDEPVDDNPMVAQRDTHRIFGAKPGAYGAGLQALIDEKIWDTKADLAAAYVIWGAYAYGAKAQGENDEATFKRRLAGIEAVIHNQDNREHDLLDSDDYYQFEGGMTAAVEEHSGTKPKNYHSDHSRPERPVIRTLEEEISRVMRARVVNPKWINGVKRHGYKGAFEIAATVDYMFAFAATTGAVQTHHFDLAYDAYILDDETRAFIAENNPAALKEIAARFEEAIARNLWQPRLNSAYDRLKDLQK
jgi:cobaltochelatase CobN